MSSWRRRHRAALGATQGVLSAPCSRTISACCESASRLDLRDRRLRARARSAALSRLASAWSAAKRSRSASACVGPRLGGLGAAKPPAAPRSSCRSRPPPRPRTALGGGGKRGAELGIAGARLVEQRRDPFRAPPGRRAAPRRPAERPARSSAFSIGRGASDGIRAGRGAAGKACAKAAEPRAISRTGRGLGRCIASAPMRRLAPPATGLRAAALPPMSPSSRAPVAQLDRAPDYEFGGRRFESFRARHSPPKSIRFRARWTSRARRRGPTAKAIMAPAAIAASPPRPGGAPLQRLQIFEQRLLVGRGHVGPEIMAAAAVARISRFAAGVTRSRAPCWSAARPTFARS